jgi:hypothetical protein
MLLVTTWGEGLTLAVHRTDGGLVRASDRIRDVLGPIVGSRNTFGKLLNAPSPDALNATDQFRAWILVTTLGANPADWGLSDMMVPSGYDIAHLRRVLPLTGTMRLVVSNTVVDDPPVTGEYPYTRRHLALVA